MQSLLRLSALSIALTIVLQSVSLLVIESEFNLNKSYVASVLCVNRDKPKMHCDGKCVLKKELTNQQEKESSQKTITSFSSLHFFFEEAGAYHFFSRDAKIFYSQ